MASAYFNQLYDCSFNGAPFAARAAKGSFGRKVAVHKYPYRDTVWPEDTGRKAREFAIEGFLVGDDVIAQRDWMVAVCESAGPGVLVHPTHGVLSVSLLTLEVGEGYDHGREIRLHFTFIESGQQVFPALVVSTFNSILGAIGISDTAGVGAFVTKVTASIQLGASVVQRAVQTVTTFTALSKGLVKNATNIFHLATSIPGSFGRYSAGNTGSGTGSIVGGFTSTGAIAAQLAALTARGADVRASVTAAGDSLNAVAATGAPAAIALSVQSFSQTILAAVTDPKDAVQIFSQIASLPQTPQVATAPIGQAHEIVQNGLSDLFRLSAISGLAQAASYYQPLSYDDAAQLRESICAIIDNEITIAGDQGQDDTFMALTLLRAAVVQDLTTRGASLAAVVNKSFKSSLPALAVSYRLYRDISRTDQVVAFADPPHPAFMPLHFPALSA